MPKPINVRSPRTKKTTPPPVERAAKKTSRRPAATPPSFNVSSEERQLMIAEAAYYIAQSNGFDPARDDQNWLEAEAQVDTEIRRRQNQDNKNLS